MVDITYRQLRREVQVFAKKVRRNSDTLTEQAKELERIATRTAKVGDMIAAMQVSTATVGDMSELSKTMQAAAKGASEFIAASDTTAKAADAADEQAQASHEGINEAVGRSPDHAGDSGWYRQE